ncbi:hypothetical protein ACA910_006237 [Epithemia clementina (nom. ined.)]
MGRQSTKGPFERGAVPRGGTKERPGDIALVPIWRRKDFAFRVSVVAAGSDVGGGKQALACSTVPQKMTKNKAFLRGRTVASAGALLWTYVQISSSSGKSLPLYNGATRLLVLSPIACWQCWTGNQYHGK